MPAGVWADGQIHKVSLRVHLCRFRWQAKHVLAAPPQSLLAVPARLPPAGCRLPARAIRGMPSRSPWIYFRRKELLWPFIREFADRGIAHVTKMLETLADVGHRCELHCIHGHYADAGEAAVLMSNTLNANTVMTGHSLGRNKLEHLLGSGENRPAPAFPRRQLLRCLEPWLLPACSGPTRCLPGHAAQDP